MPDLPAWWSDAGSAGWTATGWLGASWPWTLGGHAVGAWTFREPGRAPAGLPPPGVVGVQTPIAWYDSTTVRWLEDTALEGYGAGLATGVGFGDPRFTRGSRTVLDLRSGDFAYDENALTILRSDSVSWTRLETMSGTRGPESYLAATGRHVWGGAAGYRRGPHAVEGSYSQRGASIQLTSEEEQAATGESGTLAYRYTRGTWSLGLAARRGHDRHESLGLLVYSLREAQRTAITADAVLRRGASRLEGRLAFVQDLVSRRTPGLPSGDDNFLRRGRSAWVALRLDRPLREGGLVLDLGAGRHGPLDRIDVAPGAAYRFAAGPFDARVGIARVLEPVWTDLAPGTGTFLQSTWAGVMEVGAGRPGGRHGRAGFLVGRTRDRALVARLPLEELWLRLGVRRDADTYDFALLEASAEWPVWRVSLGGRGFVLARQEGGNQARVDPPAGFRAWLGWHGALFQGDLGMLVRAELEGVGERVSQGAIPDLCGSATRNPERPLAGWVIVGASGQLSMGRVLMSLRARNLLDQKLEEPWLDCGTGTEAIGPGREFRFALTARLAN